MVYGRHARALRSTHDDDENPKNAKGEVVPGARPPVPGGQKGVSYFFLLFARSPKDINNVFNGRILLDVQQYLYTPCVS